MLMKASIIETGHGEESRKSMEPSFPEFLKGKDGFLEQYFARNPGSRAS